MSKTQRCRLGPPQPSESIWALVSGLPADKRRNRLLSMLQVFVDESESVGDGIYAMAGYISTAENWVRFIGEWEEVKSRVPRIESFKFSECIKQKGQFYGCSEDASLDKMAELYDIIGKHALAYVTSAVQPKKYKEVFSGIREQKVVRSSYALLLFTLITGLMRHMETLGLNGPVEFIFDNQVMEEWKVLDAWHRTRLSFRPRWISIR